jgi:hypothetical protein
LAIYLSLLETHNIFSQICGLSAAEMPGFTLENRIYRVPETEAEFITAASEFPNIGNNSSGVYYISTSSLDHHSVSRWVRNLLSNIKGGTQTESVWEQGTEENI